jgi:hypothetical protein
MGKKHRKLVRHHKQCRSNGGDNEKANISIVQEDHHRAWHTIFSNLLPPTISFIINDKWLDPRWKMLCVRTEKYSEARRAIKHLLD